MRNRFKKILVFDIELFLLRNMTSVIILILWIIWLLYCFWKIDLTYSFTSSWAIIAFWYWYKKYERDKEIEIAQHLSIELNNNVESVIFNWHINRVLYIKGYLRKYLWEILEDKYSTKLYNELWVLNLNEQNINMEKVIDIWLILNSLIAYKLTKEYFLGIIKKVDSFIDIEIDIYEKNK